MSIRVSSKKTGNSQDLPLELVVDAIYRRADIHAEFGGQSQSGISTPSRFPLVLLFITKRGSDYGYADRWGENGTYFCSGQGQIGDMEWTRGNAAVRDHRSNGKDIALFIEITKGHYQFRGFFGYVDATIERHPDRLGNDRAAIVFELTPYSASGYFSVGIAPSIDSADDFEELRRKAIAASREIAPTSTSTSTRTHRERSGDVVAYALARAGGICESCENRAPFISKSRSDPYLEVHHIDRITDDGPDKPESVAAICPNCHREIHHGENGDEVNKRLNGIVLRLEAEQDANS